MQLTQRYDVLGQDYFGQAFTIHLVETDPERVGYITLELAATRLSLTIEEWEEIVTIVRGAQTPLHGTGIRPETRAEGR